MTEIEEGFAANNGLAGNQASADAESLDSGDSRHEIRLFLILPCLARGYTF